MVETFTNTANSAAVLGNQTYDPYGNQRYSQRAMGTAKGFTSQYANASGLDYYNARYYDPVVGQFTAPDTVGGTIEGTYHWDDQFGSDGKLAGHDKSNSHTWTPHLQIYPEGWNGRSIHVFFNPDF